MQITLELDATDVKVLCSALFTEQLSMGNPEYFAAHQRVYYNLCTILNKHIQEAYMKAQKELENES